MLDHWEACLDDYQERAPFGGRGAARLSKLRRCGYLSREDALIIADALRLGCDALLTLEREKGCLGASANRDHMRRTLGLTVLGPLQLWQQLRPWAGLFV